MKSNPFTITTKFDFVSSSNCTVNKSDDDDQHEKVERTPSNFTPTKKLRRNAADADFAQSSTMLKRSRKTALGRVGSAVSNIFYTQNSTGSSGQGKTYLDSLTNLPIDPPWYIVIPTHAKWIYWEKLLKTCLIWVVFYQTFHFTFSSGEVYTLFVMNEIINSLFLIGWITNFFEAIVQEDGTIETRFSTLVTTYLSNPYCYMNVISAFPYELIYLAFAGRLFEPRMAIAMINMILQCLKIFRLKYKKMARHLEALTAYDVWLNRSPMTIAFFRVMNVVMLFVFVAHFWSCALVFFFDDFTVRDPRDSWMSKADLVDADELERYFTALYFSITTLTTIGYGDIAPVGFWERNVWIVMGISGAIMYAGIFGTVTATLQKIEKKESGLTDELQTIGTFCKLYDIPLESEMKLLTYRRHQWDATQGLQIESVLSDLPFELVTEIKACLYKEDILKISYFTDCGDTFIRAIVPFIKPSVCMSGDFIVRQGDPSGELYCLKHGVANVLISLEDDDVDQFLGADELQIVNKIKAGEMFGNVGLLLKDSHRTASVQAQSFCELWSINKEAFSFVMPDFPHILKRIVAHALHCLDRDMNNDRIGNNARKLIKKSVKELEEKMRVLSQKLHQRRGSCLPKEETRSRLRSQKNSRLSTASSRRKASRSSLASMASFFGGSISSNRKNWKMSFISGPGKMNRSNNRKSDTDDHLLHRVDSVAHRGSHVDIHMEMRRRAERRASELEDAKTQDEHMKNSTSKEARRSGNFRPRLMTNDIVNVISKKQRSPLGGGRRNSLVSHVVGNTSLEARQGLRNSTVGFAPPGINSLLGSSSPALDDRRYDHFMARMDSIEKKFDDLIDILQKGGTVDGGASGRMGRAQSGKDDSVGMERGSLVSIGFGETSDEEASSG